MLDLFSANGMIQTMDRSMGLASKRMGMIASNLANVDTPGYRTQDFSFQDALKAQLAPLKAGSPRLAQTQPGHLAGVGGGGLPPTTDPLRPSWERNDGNDVNLDRENLLLARTQGQYQLASTFLQVELRKLYQVIREGAK